jgi:peptidoglycan hydrolase CwlO-like protein
MEEPVIQISLTHLLTIIGMLGAFIFVIIVFILKTYEKINAIVLTSQGLGYKVEGVGDKLDKFIDKVENKLKEQDDKIHQTDIAIGKILNEIEHLKKDINDLKNKSS